MGGTLGLIGAGGSILTIPILVYLFKVPILLSTTYSLMIVGGSAAFAAIRYRRHIVFKKALIFGIPSSLGLFTTRAFLVPRLPRILFGIPMEKVFIGLLLCLMVTSGTLMIKRKTLSLSKRDEKAPPTPLTIVTSGICLGLFMGILGSGGGFLIIPTLIFFFELPMTKAVPTSLFIIALNSLIGFLFDQTPLLFHHWIHLGQYISVAFLGMFGGIYLSRFINSDQLKHGFGWFMLSLACFIGIKEFILWHF